MRFIMTSASERTHAPNPQPTTRRRQRRPDTTTVTVRKATDAELLHAKILDPDPNREIHYNAPTLKGRILR